MRDATFLILTVLAALSGLLAVFKLYQWRRERRQRRREEIFQLVRGATSLVYQHSVREGKAGHSAGVPIIHVRDRLIPLEEREAKAGLWGEAVEYISNNESRLRQEIQKLYGEDFHVWKWLGEISWSPQESFSPSSPSLPSSPSPPVSPGSPSMSSPSTPSNPWPHVPTTHSLAPGWQGCAFPPNKHVTAPLTPPTSCLKVRHMFDIKHQAAIAGNNWVAGVREEIVKKCCDATILHIAVDTVSQEGTVYIKTASLEDAGKVFRCLHGQWYRGQLVTAKYLRLERYHERFPDSQYSNQALTASKK